MSSYNWPPSGSGGGVTIYASFAAFPAAGPLPTGTLAIDASTGKLYEVFGGSWQVLAQLGTIFSRAQEAPSGTVNGSNVTFTLSNAPNAATLNLSLDGIIQRQGVGLEYTLSGSTITMATAPLAVPIPQTLWAIYEY